jgi:tRNA threonylcarbamoyl adenosine modification protein YeaZ
MTPSPAWTLGPDDPVVALDASTARVTVAVLRGERVLAEGSGAARDGGEEQLLPLLLAQLARAAVAPAAIRGIVVGAGPGSFTGLRVAAATAKGLAVATGAVLAAVSSPLLVVAGLADPPAPGHYLAVIDAMRGERFVASIVVDGSIGHGSIGHGSIRQVGAPRLVSATAVEALATDAGARAIGPGAAWDVWPAARGVARLGPPTAVDLASWEPDYGRASAAEDRRAAHVP